jgi:tRNA(fMet)-specific endonuclease VapC
MKTAEVFSDIKNDLQLQGKPLPINDIWIAAHTIESQSVLITFDKHFNSIKNLRTW